MRCLSLLPGSKKALVAAYRDAFGERRSRYQVRRVLGAIVGARLRYGLVQSF